MNKKLVLSVLFIFALFVSATFINSVSADTNVEDAPDASTTIVISQVYGGGGASTGTYLYDYVELFNISNVPQSLNGLALQYGSATGNFGASAGQIFALPNVTLQPGQHFLVQLGSVGSAGAAFPVTPDATSPNLSLAAAGGKIGLTNTTTGLGCGATATPCTLPNSAIIDEVSYGASNNGEGGTSAGNGTALTSTQGVVRNSNGCADTDNNNNDFTVVSNPVPRNMASAATPCGSGPTPTPTPRVLLDFTNDNRSDWATIATSSTAVAPYRWKVTGNPASPAPGAAFKREFDYGLNTTDYVVAADYIGDRKTEPTVWRKSNLVGIPGIFYVAQFPSGTAGIMLDRAIRFGATTDAAIEGGDYDGDGKADYTVVRINADNTVTWFIRSSTTGVDRAINFGSVAGISESRFFPGADFTGDGRDELIFATANFPGTGNVTYYVGDAVTGVGVITRTFGNYNTDTSLPPADYTGDGRADFVAVRETTSPTIWYINNSFTNATTATPFGVGDPTFVNADYPVRGDYDGDGKQDICVWRPSNQTFYYLRSSSNNTTVDGQKHGDAGDVPLGTLGAF